MGGGRHHSRNDRQRGRLSLSLPGWPSLSSVGQSPLVDAEFAPDMTELLWIGQSLVSEQAAQRCKARGGEKEPRQSGGRR